MHIWVVRDSEPLPTDPGNRRLMRMGMACQALSARGHEVTWITSTHDHYGRQRRPGGTQTLTVTQNYRIALLDAPGYRRNIGLARIVHNRHFARGFENWAYQQSARPDIIITDIPTTESAASVVELGQAWGVPTVVSIRDLWPDFFADFLPAPLRPLARLATIPLDRQAARACAGATALIGISPGYLQWGLDKGQRQRGPYDTIVPLGYRPRKRKATPDMLTAMGVDPSRTLVSFVGSWGATYDLASIIAAARQFEDRPEISFVVAGKGPLAEAQKAGLERAPNIVTPGWLDADQIAALLQHSSLGLSPYAAKAPQGLPNKIFEYMSYGVFQVTSLQGEAKTLLEQNGAGISVAPGDPKGLAQAIETALELATRPDTRGRIIALFKKDFDADRVYRRFAECIETVGRKGG